MAQKATPAMTQVASTSTAAPAWPGSAGLPLMSRSQVSLECSGVPEDAVIRARMDVCPSRRMVLVPHRHGQTGIGNAHDLAPHRIDTFVADELAGGQP